MPENLVGQPIRQRRWMCAQQRQSERLGFSLPPTRDEWGLAEPRPHSTLRALGGSCTTPAATSSFAVDHCGGDELPGGSVRNRAPALGAGGRRQLPHRANHARDRRFTERFATARRRRLRPARPAATTMLMAVTLSPASLW